jgi:outer membrane protein OmpA-like peptidoglycan-associated protein
MIDMERGAMKTLLTSTAVTLLLAGCAEETGGDRFFDREAGARVDTGAEFGNATMNNHLAQTGQLNETINLARRFNAEIDETVTFAFNSATLDGPARATLQQQAGWIKQFPEVRFKVFGHTDLVGSNAYNQRLGLRRANAVVGYLASQGISRNRLEAVVSLGETRPLIQSTGPERQNRRTLTEVSGFVDGHPSVLNGRYAEVIFREYVASAIPPTTVAVPTGLGGGE